MSSSHLPPALPHSLMQGNSRVFIRGEFNEDLVLPITSTLTGLISESGVKNIQLIINSPGGTLSTLRFLIGQINGHRRESNASFSTVGCGTVASAAAIALSFGDLGKRWLLDGSSLLFHDVRIMLSSNTSITASSAQHLLKSFTETNVKIIAALIDHIAPLFKLPDSTYRFPIRNVTESIFEEKVELVKAADLEGFKATLLPIFQAVFEVDKPMTSNTAIALGLIDKRSTILPNQEGL
jgi:ATP-dependent protease ClpP protease subunit